MWANWSRAYTNSDLLSPYLFILCFEGFSALLHSAEESGALKGFERSGGLLLHISFFTDKSLFLHEQTSPRRWSWRNFFWFMRAILDKLSTTISPAYFLAKGPLMSYARIFAHCFESWKGKEIISIWDFLSWLGVLKRRFLATSMIGSRRNWIAKEIISRCKKGSNQVSCSGYSYIRHVSLSSPTLYHLLHYWPHS